MMRTVSVALLIVGLLLLPSVAQTTATDRLLVTPGVGIGPIRLGMTAEEFQAAAGMSPSQVSNEGGGKLIYYFNSASGWLSVETSRGHAISVEGAFDHRFHLANGLTVGDTRDRAVVLRGRFDTQHQGNGDVVWSYHRLGLAVWVDEDPSRTTFDQVVALEVVAGAPA